MTNAVMVVRARTLLLAGVTVAGLASVAPAHADEVIGAPPGTTAPPVPTDSTATTAPVAPAAAPASGPAAAQSSETEPKARWYGWQTLVADGAALVILVGAIKAENGGIGALSLGTYLLGGPIVHWAHGNVGRGFASAGIRFGAPLLLGLGGAVLADDKSKDGFAALGGFAVGFLLGVGGAVAVDAAVLARDHVEVPRATKVATIAPSFMPVRSGAIAGVSGAF